MKEIEVRPFKEIIFRGAYPKEVKEEVTKQEVPLIISGIRKRRIKVKEVELFSEVKEMGATGYQMFGYCHEST